MTTYYHGSKSGEIGSGRVFFAADREYAEGYGVVSEVEIDERSLRVLDLSSVRSGEDCEYDHDAALALIADAGIDTTDIVVHEGCEGHGLIRQLCDLGRLDDFDAVKIHEWTLYVGETISLCILRR